MEYKSFEIGQNSIHYQQVGSGKQIIIAFHGYGLSSSSFLPAITKLTEKYTLLLFDLPFQGLTTWNNEAFSCAMLETLVKKTCTVYNVTKISLLGYSLGGRVCLKIAELMPFLIDKFVLLAPDGLVFNLPYYLATKNTIGKPVFKHVVSKPQIFLCLTDLLLKIKLIDASRHKFVTQHLKTKQQRDFLFNVWTNMAKMVPHFRKLKSIIRTRHLIIHIFVGKYDKIIPASYATKFASNLNSVNICVLNKGHKMLDETIAEQLNEIF